MTTKKKTRRRFSAQEKVALLKRHLVDKVPISTLCDEAGLHVNQFYQWQRQFFENGAAAFERKAARNDPRDERIAALEQKLAGKNEVLAELLEEHVQLKKELGEL